MEDRANIDKSSNSPDNEDKWAAPPLIHSTLVTFDWDKLERPFLAHFDTNFQSFHIFRCKIRFSQVINIIKYKYKSFNEIHINFKNVITYSFKHL